MIQHELNSEKGILVLKPQGRLEAEDFAAIARETDAYIEKQGALSGLMIVAEKFLNRMEKYLGANRYGVGKEKTEQALKTMREIQEQRTKMREMARQNVDTIKTTFHNLRSFRRGVRW